METTTLIRTLEAWNVPGPWRVSELARGTNNLVYRAGSPAGEYVLVVISNHANTDRLRFEHAVLARLAAQALPFAVPTPVRTRAGETYALFTSDEGQHELAILTPLIAGEHPDREDITRAVAAGEALGLLDTALRRIVDVSGEQAVSWRSYGDLEHCHPLVRDPLTAIQELPVAEATRQRLAARYKVLTRRLPHIYATLPRQLVHEDYDPSNMLMVGERVSGVLDFEFCSRDLRVMDLTVALSWWPVRQLGTGNEWPVIEAFTRGYARHVTLQPEEIAALPALYELRAFSSLIHRLGRYRQGLSPLEAVAARADAALEREDWLLINGERLVRIVAALAATTGRKV